MMLDERAITEFDRRSGGHIVEAMVRYSGSPSRRWYRLRPVVKNREANYKRYVCREKRRTAIRMWSAERYEVLRALRAPVWLGGARMGRLFVCLRPLLSSPPVRFRCAEAGAK